MHSTCAQRIIVLTAVLVVAVCSSGVMVTAATPCCEGTQWLRAAEDARTAYIDGYVEGRLRGFGQGCLTGTEGVKASSPGPDADPFHKCLSKNVTFSKTTMEYVKSITQFYEKYPEDRDMRVSEVLMDLSQGLDLDQIHFQHNKHAEAGSKKDVATKE
jgi:hypothetical protein